jgi:hypothetical protein
MRNLMTVEEAKGVCKDLSKWKEVISACRHRPKFVWSYIKRTATIVTQWFPTRLTVDPLVDDLTLAFYTASHKMGPQLRTALISITALAYMCKIHVTSPQKGGFMFSICITLDIRCTVNRKSGYTNLSNFSTRFSTSVDFQS